MDMPDAPCRIYGSFVDAECNAIRVQDSRRTSATPQCSLVCTNPELTVAQAQTLIDLLQRFVDTAGPVEQRGFEEPSHDVRPDFR